MISIQTNVNSLVAQQNLSVNSAFQSKTIAQLTSGYRINQSGDDAAGLAVANKFRSTVAELTQGVANGNDATAQLQIMDGGMSNISSILDRLKTLATQSASGTFTGNRATLNSEFQNALSEVDRQAQSIGLNTGGLFAKNLDVYMGVGSGSQTLQNGVVTLGLTQSAVDSQSLGMRGMQAVNLTSGLLGSNNIGNDIGTTSATSVQNIVGNISGANLNQQATAGYAALLFTGAGFSDAGKIGISVNLTGVTDLATLAAAVNTAIQAAGNGITAAATAFKNANIVASVHTDSVGGQQLAFSSGAAAFQVQAGDQMANALMGNVAVVGGVAKGTAVAATATTTVTGATTLAGDFASTDIVKLVITGGGLASPVSLQVNLGTLGLSTSGAITDLESQFVANAQLQVAGLSMSGSATVGSQLSFSTGSGQGFNIQVTGDRANLLGLGSFLAGTSGNADYAKITAGVNYNDAAVTGSAQTHGLAAGLEVSLNGLGSIALIPIDLTAGAHAVAASTTSTAGIAGSAPGNGPGIIDITALNQNLDITVTNNGVATNAYINLSTSAGATKGAAISSVTGARDFAVSPVIVSAAGLNNSFMVAVDGGTATKITLTDGSYATKGDFLTEINARLTAAFGGGVVATYADGVAPGDQLGALTLTSAHVAGAASSVSIAAATTATSGTITSAGGPTLTNSTYTPSTIISAALHNNSFSVSQDGGASTLITLRDNTYVAASDFLAEINNRLTNAGLTNVHASWGAFGGAGTGALTLTSATPGAASMVSVAAVTYASSGTVTSSAASLTRAGFTAYNATVLAHNNEFTVAVDGGAAQTVTLTGSYAGTTGGADLFMADLQTALSGRGVTAGWGAGGELTITSNATGHLSSVVLGTATYATAAVNASTLLGSSIFGAPITVVTASNDTFDVSVNGGASKTVTVGPTATTNKDVLLGLVQVGLDAQFGAGPGGTHVTASWAGGGTGALTLTTDATGAAASISVSATAGGNTGFTAFGFSGGVARGDDTAGTNSGLTTIRLNASTTPASGSDAAVNAGLAEVGLSTTPTAVAGSNGATNTGLTTVGLSAGLHVGRADGPATAASIAAQIQTALGVPNALVTVSNDYKISIASTTKGANSSVVLNATAQSAYADLHLNLGAGQVLGQNSSIVDLVDNLNAQFSTNSTYQAAGLTAAATLADGTGSGSYITIQSNNNTQFRLNSLGAAAVATAGALSSTVTATSVSATSSIIVGAASGKFQVAVDGGAATTVSLAAATYTSGAEFLAAVQLAISNTALDGLVTAAFDAATRKLTLTSATTGVLSSVTTSAEYNNTGLANLGFGTGATNSGQLFSHTENLGFGVAGTTFEGAVSSSTGTAMSALDAFGITNSTSFTFAAMKYGNDKQALTFSATDANGVLETKTITLQNSKALGANRAGVSIDDAVAYINQQLQQSTSNPALQKIVAVKENVGGAEKINFVSSLSNFTVGLAATANLDGLNGGLATQQNSTANGTGANMAIETQAGAKAAVAALVGAVAALGAAQAAVGKGQNQLSYAVSLAQSQITNFSAAESVIRDANVAQQAANLSKAQVLSQASIAAMAQANAAPQAVLSLLRG